MAKVLPAQAGVILTFAFALISKGCTPRASGGDPPLPSSYKDSK